LDSGHVYDSSVDEISTLKELDGCWRAKNEEEDEEDAADAEAQEESGWRRQFSSSYCSDFDRIHC
jgi:hypothetical protein